MLKNYVYHTEWNIGISRRQPNEAISNIAKLCHDSQVVWLDKRFHFQADPFLVEWKEKLYVFYEALNHSWKNGQIRCRVLNQDFRELEDFPIEDINQLDCHLSFPAIWKFNNDYYLIPESCRKNSLHIFKAINFPRNWEQINVIPDVSLVDTIILKRNDYYLLISSQTNTLKRKVFFSKHLQGDWRLIGADITISDEHTRLGGSLFTIGDNCFIPCQNTDSHDYGKSLWLKQLYIPNNLEDIDQSWQELTVIHMTSHSKRYPDGIHTLNFSQNYVVIDAKKNVFQPFTYLRNKFNDLIAGR